MKTHKVKDMKVSLIMDSCGRFTYYAIEGYVSGKVDFINDSISSAQMFHEMDP